MGKKLLVAVLLTFLIFTNAYGDQPKLRLEKHINSVVTLLTSPEYKGETGKSVKNGKIREVIREMFDYDYVARMALGRNWRLFSPEEKRKFSNTFAEFLGNIYLGKIDGVYGNLSVKYHEEELLGKGRALVKTTVRKENVTTPVDYYLTGNGESWRVYNVKIEGVSMLSNYRSQFNKILLKNDPAYLIEQIEMKLARIKQ
jgi:phospholipid transport system substrate-binding protein